MMRARLRNTRGRVGVRLVATVVWLAAFAPTGAISAFELVRGSHSGSASTSTGGAFTARTTTSQPDAGAASGGGFQVTGSVTDGDPGGCYALAQITSLAASDDLCSGVLLSWLDDNRHESGFRVYRNSVAVAETSPDATGFLDVTASGGTNYTYAVVAISACASSDLSPADAGRRQQSPVAPDGVVARIATVSESEVSVELLWNDHSPEESVQRILRTDGTPVVIATVAPNLTTTTVTVPNQGGGSYCFAVAAANCGLEAVSSTVCLPIGSVAVDDTPTPASLPVRFALGPATPNPFAGRVAFAFDVPSETPVSLRVYDVRGRLVRTLREETLAPGHYRVEWDGMDESRTHAGAGIYFAEMRAAGWTQTSRIVLRR